MNAFGGDPSVEVQAIRASVERGSGFVQAGFRRHGANCTRRDVRSVDREHPDPAGQRGGEGCEQVTRMDMAAQGFQVPPGTPYGSRLDIRCMQLHLRGMAKDGGSHGPGSAAEIHHHRGCRQCGIRREGQGVLRQQVQGRVDQEFRASPRHENAGLNHHAAAGKFSPAQDVLEGDAFHPLLDIA